MPPFLRLLLSALLSLACLVQARYICNPTSASDSYPYCINIPDKMPSDNCGGALPLVIYLGGAGTRGSGGDVYSRTTYDGFGMLLSRYRNGNSSQVTLAAERFVTVIPMAPYTEPGNPNQAVYHYWAQNINKVIASVRAAYGPIIDWKRVHCVGYSQGARGCWRYSEANSGTLISTTSIGGAAEQAGEKYLLLEPTTPTFPYLDQVVSLHIRQYAGTRDDVASVSSAQSTQNELFRLGARNSNLYTLNIDHLGLQTAPFNVDLLSWLLTHEQSYGDRPCEPASSNTPILFLPSGACA